MKRIIITWLFLSVASVPAGAQTRTPAAVSISGFGGVSFLSEPGAVVGATLAVKVSSSVDVIVGGGHLTNILPPKIQRDLDAAARAIGDTFGGGLTIDGRAPAIYGMGGLRIRHTAGRRMTFFLDAGAGAARGTSRIRARASGIDVSQAVTAALHIKRSEEKPLIAIGGGIGIPMGEHLGLDLGYRYMRIFTDEPRIDTAAMTAGVGWRF